MLRKYILNPLGTLLMTPGTNQMLDKHKEDDPFGYKLLVLNYHHDGPNWPTYLRRVMSRRSEAYMTEDEVEALDLEVQQYPKELEKRSKFGAKRR